MKSLSYGSLFAGVGGFDRGLDAAGLECRWQCEKDKHCQKLLRAKWPHAKLHDDITTLRPAGLERVDVVCGGSPCQGFSVAGLRGSLADDRSNLCLRYCEIVDAVDPAVVVWENVGGVLSAADNAFGCFLARLVGADAPLVPTAECGGRWTNAGVVSGPRRTAAWRCLDSQFFGVAQRRFRMFVVASPRAELPFQILFESDRMRRHYPPSRESREGVAGTIAARTAGSGGLGTDFEVDGGLIPEIAWALQERDSKGSDSKGSDSSTKDGHLIPIAFDTTQITSPENRCQPQRGDPCHPLSTTAHAPAIAFQTRIARNGRGQPDEIVPALNGTNAGDTSDMRPCVVTPRMAVRRLLPVECCRLMGWPDDHLDGFGFSDSTKYKMCGNGVVASVSEWIGKRIAAALICE